MLETARPSTKTVVANVAGRILEVFLLEKQNVISSKTDDAIVVSQRTL